MVGFRRTSAPEPSEESVPSVCGDPLSEFLIGPAVREVGKFFRDSVAGWASAASV